MQISPLNFYLCTATVPISTADPVLDGKGAGQITGMGLIYLSLRVTGAVLCGSALQIFAA